MKTAPQKFLAFAACFALVVCMSGCASNRGCGNSWLPSNPFKDRPVRNTIKSWFSGAPCNSCNAPAGQPLHFGTNTAPTCTSCGEAVTSGYAPVDNGVSLYGDTNLNGPVVDSMYGQSPTPIYTENSGVVGEIEGAIGSGVAGDGVFPPPF